MLVRYVDQVVFFIDFDIVSLASIFIGITFFTFHINRIPAVCTLYVRNYRPFFLSVLHPPKLQCLLTDVSFYSLSRIMIAGLFFLTFR